MSELDSRLNTDREVAVLKLTPQFASVPESPFQSRPRLFIGSMDERHKLSERVACQRLS